MPPKNKFTKQEIVEAALAVTKEGGFEAVTARSVAAKLGSSPKVIFGIFENMEQLNREVVIAAKKMYEQYIEQEFERGEFPPYKSSGMAYIRFAKQETELFKLLFMRDRSKEEKTVQVDIEPIINIIMQNNDISHEKAELLHLEMWIVVHGIASMIATSYLSLEWDLISRIVTDVYQGVRKRFIEAEE